MNLYDGDLGEGKGEVQKSEKLIETNLENFSKKFNLLLDEAKRIEKYME